jgi:transcriptional regulator GlxA family with amidase domain
MKSKKLLKGAIIIALFIALIFNACAPLREFGSSPIYQGANDFTYQSPSYDSSKRTVIIVANNDGTELFDMMAPYYLFNATEKANVYIVAKNKVPVVVKKGFFLLPQFTFTEVDSLGINPDVIVIPYLSAGDSLHQDPVIVNWIKKHYSVDVNILAVCDGAATAAATGIFDGKPITAHASDYTGIKAYFSKPLWVQNISVANDGNLYSTAGVSNATEGSLVLINKLFGPEIMRKVREDINYPYPLPKTAHQSNTFHFNDKVAVGKKIIFKNNKKIGMFLQDDINEFELAAIMDTYNRTFPESIESYSGNDLPIKTKYGLTLIPTGKSANMKLDELHIIDPLSFSKANQVRYQSTEIVKYDNLQKQYIIDECLQRINDEYGEQFNNIVKLMLDYN